MDDAPPGCIAKDSDFNNGCTGCVLYDETKNRAKSECGDYECTKTGRKDGRTIIYVKDVTNA